MLITRYKNLALLAVLPLTAALCDRDKELLCGDPAVGTYLTYELVDAATGQNWYAAPGRPPGDSLRLLPSAMTPTPGYAHQRGASRLGPVAVYSFEPVLNNQQTVTHYLSLGNGDIDTVQLTLRFAPNPRLTPAVFPLRPTR
jgi:hypothetical protein